MEKRIEKIKKMNSEMKNLEKDIKFLEETFEKMQEINKRFKNLEKYYYSDWLKDYEDKRNFEFEILNQDSLYNSFVDKDQIEKKILKFLVENL